MQLVVLVVHLLIALFLIGVIMLQKSEGGGLGLGTGGGGMSGFMTGRSTANLLTRTTAILFAAFILTSVTLAVLGARAHATHGSILDRIPTESPLTAPAMPSGKAPAAPAAPASPAAPAVPSVPLAK